MMSVRRDLLRNTHSFQQIGVDFFGLAADRLQLHGPDIKMPHALFQHDQAARNSSIQSYQELAILRAIDAFNRSGRGPNDVLN
jgi:hypothetical protein